MKAVYKLIQSGLSKCPNNHTFQHLNDTKIVLVHSIWIQRPLDIHKPSNVFILKYTNLSDSEGVGFSNLKMTWLS